MPAVGVCAPALLGASKSACTIRSKTPPRTLITMALFPGQLRVGQISVDGPGRIAWIVGRRPVVWSSAGRTPAARIGRGDAAGVGATAHRQSDERDEK